jgi:hypothetical protein
MLRAWAKIVVARRNLVLWITLGLVVAAGILTGTRLVIRNSTLDLIRKDSPVFQKYLAYMEEFDVRDEIVVVLKSDDLKASRKAANRLAEKLKAEKGLSRVYYRHDFSPMADRLLLLADEEQLTGIRRQMEELATLVRGNKKALNLNGILGEASSKFNDPYLRKSSNWQEFIPFIEEFVRNLKRLAKDLETPVVEGNGQQGLGELSEFEADLLRNEYLSLGEDGKTILMLLRPSVEEQKSATPFTAGISGDDHGGDGGTGAPGRRTPAKRKRHDFCLHPHAGADSHPVLHRLRRIHAAFDGGGGPAGEHRDLPGNDHGGDRSSQHHLPGLHRDDSRAGD